jgi:pimeloyl-ACP methyl ester carboxylesterase
MSVADPIASFVASTRDALAAAGLERVQRGGDVYWRGGSGGTTLVLLHGVNDQAGTWSPIVPMLVDRYRLIVPDLAGHGESAPASGPLPMKLIVERLRAIVENEGDRPVTLVGNSMGGWVSFLYAFSNDVERLILEDSSGMMWTPTVPLFPRTREEAMIALRGVHGPDAVIHDFMVEAMLQRAIDSPLTRVAEAGVFEYLVDARLPQLDRPVSLIWGADDGVLPVAYAEALRQRIRGATLEVIPGAAHIPHRQQPEKFVACLTAIC